MSDTTTHGIRVQARSRYVSELSAPSEGHYLFAYHITISNVGTETARLVSRHWFITDAEGRTVEVEGPGVIGEQPVLAPGMSFEYTSFCPLTTGVGSMHGTYRMVTLGGTAFEARVSPFTLAMPNSVN